MAYIDNNLVVAGTITLNPGAASTITGQAAPLTANGTVVSTNTIDLGIGRDLGEGMDLFMRVQTIAAYTATAAATIEFQIITASDAALTLNVSVIGSSGPVPVSNAVLPSGGSFVVGATYKVATIGTTDFTLIGGANVVGSIFTATGVGAGTGTATLSGLIAGSKLAASLNPLIGSKSQRYLGVKFVVTGTLLTGSSFIDFGIDIQDGQKFYPNGFAIL